MQINRNTNKDNFYYAVIILSLLFGSLLLYLIKLETNWIINSNQCVGTVSHSEVKKINTGGRIKTTKYKCYQNINSDGLFTGIVSYQQYGGRDDLECKNTIGTNISGYCYDNEFRKRKISNESLIGIVFLLGIFIFAGKLVYNHQQRKNRTTS